jgi:hypothetical protein
VSDVFAVSFADASDLFASDDSLALGKTAREAGAAGPESGGILVVSAVLSADTFNLSAFGYIDTVALSLFALSDAAGNTLVCLSAETFEVTLAVFVRFTGTSASRSSFLGVPFEALKDVLLFASPESARVSGASVLKLVGSGFLVFNVPARCGVGASDLFAFYYSLALGNSARVSVAAVFEYLFALFVRAVLSTDTFDLFAVLLESTLGNSAWVLFATVFEFLGALSVRAVSLADASNLIALLGDLLGFSAVFVADVPFLDAFCCFLSVSLDACSKGFGAFSFTLFGFGVSLEAGLASFAAFVALLSFAAFLATLGFWA